MVLGNVPMAVKRVDADMLSGKHLPKCFLFNYYTLPHVRGNLETLAGM